MQYALVKGLVSYRPYEHDVSTEKSARQIDVTQDSKRRLHHSKEQQLCYFKSLEI